MMGFNTRDIFVQIGINQVEFQLEITVQLNVNLSITKTPNAN